MLKVTNIVGWKAESKAHPVTQLITHCGAFVFLEPRREQAPSCHPFLALIQALFGVRIFLVIPN